MHHYPFHPGDYMLATAHLSLEEDATLRRALDLYYSTEAPLSLDKQTLSKRLRVAEQTLSNVLAEFFVETPEGWKNLRCDAEISRYKARSEKAKKSGSLGGKARVAHIQANAKRTLSEKVANQNQNQEPKKEESLPLPFLSQAFADSWAKWTRHRKELKKALTPTMIEAQFGLMRKMGESRAIAMIEHTIAKGWQGLREDDSAPIKPKYQSCL